MTRIHLRSDSAYRVHVDPRRLREAARKTLTHEAIRGQVELTIVITGDQAIHALNRQYRGVDAPTDVLSFAEAPIESTPDASNYLGDVIISYPRAQAQAQAAGHSTADELALLVIHGVLHLLGHDHATRAQKRRMWTAQADILREMGARVNVPML